MLKPSIIAAALDPDNLPANISEERAAALYGGGKGKHGPKRWLDGRGAGHSASGVTGIPSVAELVAATAREYEGARRETAKLF
ncbi:hypothetical protein BKK79_27285 [Cupriavidus sp. USMAA2-4]|uniref:hypothetical protein n=1 Tax=Cupriavidus sp. USMAA2-4 TaxID=876364 RepID=UPI0008A6D4DD|nr:hypothetical protein [Cupriavidus sp. USMAA2-4]AOY95465.1 hypothetical protein BKK79_27285 [Cupriavidus sp. USMAA2-4]